MEQTKHYIYHNDLGSYDMSEDVGNGQKHLPIRMHQT